MIGLALGAVAGPAGAASPAVTSAQRAQAKKALLVPSDLPHGWAVNTKSGFTVSSADVGANQQVARCEGISPSAIEFNAPEFPSPMYGDASSTEFAENTMLVFRSASTARQMDAAVTSPKFAGCLAAASRQGSTGTTGSASSGISFTRFSSPNGTAAYEASGSGQGVVVTFFVHGQYGDATFIIGPATSVQPLALHLLSAERSRL